MPISNVSEICFRWGFNEAAHFSRVFREQYGMSPAILAQADQPKQQANTAAHREPNILSIDASVPHLTGHPLAIPADRISPCRSVPRKILGARLCNPQPR